MIIDFKTITSDLVGQTVTVGGYVHSVRDHGGLIFIDLRNETELVQCVVDPERNKDAFAIAEGVNSEFVLEITGDVTKRDESLINPKLATGEIEIEIKEIKVVGKAKTPPFDIHAENALAGEDVRLKYRYLDFRREKLHNLIKLRHYFLHKTRNWFTNEGFIEVQTPILSNSSPEGARDYLVPSRLHPGTFYALPQAPQQYKQLLMVGGFNKYFQIAPCFRDEDPRADRAVGDFYQLDLEMAWSRQEDVFQMFEKFCRETLQDPELTKKTLLDSDGFERIPYFEAMDLYGSDKPDRRYELPWKNAKPVFENCGFKVFADLCGNNSARVQALKIPGGASKFSRSDLDKIQDIGRSFGLPGLAYIQYQEEGAKSPIFKFLADSEEGIEAKKQEIQSFFEAETGDLILFIANENKQVVWKAQNSIRQHVAQKLDLIDESVLKFAWIYDFPFFEEDEKTGKLDFSHNPFGLWHADEDETQLETLEKYASEGRLTELRAAQYDITCNGYEISSGGERNNNPEALIKAFSYVGYTEEQVRTEFAHMLEAYEYGAPYHAGFAPGIDRFMMILIGEDNIREVIPFPLSGSGASPMTGAPSTVSKQQLKELGISI